MKKAFLMLSISLLLSLLLVGCTFPATTESVMHFDTYEHGAVAFAEDVVHVDMPESEAVASANVAQSGTWGSLTWTFNETTGHLTISGTGAIGFFNNSLDATHAWRKYRTSIKTVTIGKGITSIGDYAFYYCTNLTSVIFSENSQLTSIEFFVFEGCSSLTSIDIPNKVTSIGGRAFRGCSSLTNIDIPDGVTQIADGAFWGCTGLTSITIPDSMTYIEANTFKDCSSLMSITIPTIVRYIGYDAFSGTAYYNNTTNWQNNMLYIGNCLISAKTTIENCTIKNGTIVIAGGAFEGCSSLTSIAIPDGVTHIGWSAFENCTSLTSIEIPNSVTAISNYAFRNCTSLTSITIPDGVTHTGNYSTFYGCINLKIVYINSPTIATQLTSVNACNYLITNAEVILVNKSITDITSYVTDNFIYSEELTYEGTDYVSYSKHAHVWETMDDVRCGEIGFVGSQCTICGLLKGNTITSAHNFVPHSAGDEDYHWDVCEDCGEIANKAPHSWNSGEVTTPATHISTGVMTYTCDVCERTYTEVIEKIAEHNYGEWIEAVEPGCETVGTLAHYHCECGLDFDADKNVIDDLTIPATGHSFGEWNVSKAPTCTEAGEERRDCDNCDHCETRDIPETEHSLGEWVISKAPTCTETGEERRDCDNCDHYETRDIPATGHDYTDIFKCAVCGKDSGMSILITIAIIVLGIIGFSLLCVILKKKRLKKKSK